MLTPEQKENILTIMAKKRQDIVYRDRTKLVRRRLSDLIIDGDKILNNQIWMVRIRLKDLESIYERRIKQSAVSTVARDFSCPRDVIDKLVQKNSSELSDYLQNKYSW